MQRNAPILDEQSTAALWPCRTLRGAMERASDGIELKLLDGKALDAANDPVIDGARPAAGWDPFEIWRTRVRDQQLDAPAEGPDPKG